MVADPKFKIWINTQLYGLELAESKVARDMAEKNIRVEVKKDGKWICQ